jgi:SAM-dependent methyltransferase
MNVRPNDYRTLQSRLASNRVIELCENGQTVLALGGGPFRVHPRVIDVNIAPLENVDVVGDAHRLPFADGSFDGLYCEAVFEHLDDPHIAAAETFRVMKPGAIGYVCTPFMQPFHGYPSHFQNFTIFGHRRLFERAGFKVLEAGTAGGPATGLATVVATFLAEYSPRLIRWPMRAAWAVFANIAIRPLDRWLAGRPNAYVVASTTYLLIEKL